jgi:hypothetical protein
MSAKDANELDNFLTAAEGIDSIGHAARKSSGLMELGHLLYANLPGFFAGYAGGKVLDYVHDEILEWWNKKRREPAFITLQLEGSSKRKKIGKGTPKRYDRRARK